MYSKKRSHSAKSEPNFPVTKRTNEQFHWFATTVQLYFLLLDVATVYAVHATALRLAKYSLQYFNLINIHVLPPPSTSILSCSGPLDEIRFP